jgi:hypothetical protein
MTTDVGHFDANLLEMGAEGALGAVQAAGARGPSLVDAWVKHRNAAAVAEVAAHGEGPARKAARRGLNVLKARGIAVPAARRVGSIAGRTGDAVVEAWMFAPDATGAEMFAITSHTATSRRRTCVVYLHPRRGVARVENHTLSQSQLKEYFQKVLPGAGYGAIRVPVSWARARIAAARKIHADTGAAEPLGFSTARELLEPVPPEPPAHPFDDEGLELSDEDAAALARTSAELHRLPEFRGWLPTQQAVQELLVQLGQKITPGEQPAPDRMTELLKGEVEAATDRYFSPEVREHIIELMKDSALSVLAREGEQRALEVAAVIKASANCGLITDPPHGVPFLRGFFDKAVALMIQQGGGRLRIPVPQGAAAAPDDSADAAQGNESALVTPEEAPSAPSVPES